MEPLTIVSMGLPEEALNDADFVEQVYGFPNKATAVGAALALTRLVAKEHADDSRTRLMLHNADGTVYEVRLPWKVAR